MKRMNTLYKISFSALFIALGIILSRFLSISYIFGLPFLKVGFTNSIVMFASFYLGPIWGLIVGGASDVFGALLYPQGGAFNPLYTTGQFAGENKIEVYIKRQIPIYRTIDRLLRMEDSNSYYKLDKNFMQIIPIEDIANWLVGD